VVFPVHPVLTMRQNGGKNFLYALQDMRLSTSSLQAPNEAFAANEAAYRFAMDALQTQYPRERAWGFSPRALSEMPSPQDTLNGVRRETVSNLGERLVRRLQRRREPHVLKRI